MNTFGNYLVGFGTLVLLVLGGQWVYNTYIRQDWIGMYESRTSNTIYTNNFSSREDCGAWLHYKQDNPGSYTNYECGKNCEPPTTALGLYKCQESFD